MALVVQEGQEHHTPRRTTVTGHGEESLTLALKTLLTSYPLLSQLNGISLLISIEILLDYM